MRLLLNVSRIIPLFLVTALLSSIGFTGCTTHHQVLRYEVPLIYSNRLIPGIEPEEALDKVVVRVLGKGIEPAKGTPIEKKLMAERAAVLDGYRQLAERLAGMIIETRSGTKNNGLTVDQVMTEASAYLRGAQISTISYQAGFATADIRLYLEPRENRFVWR